MVFGNIERISNEEVLALVSGAPAAGAELSELQAKLPIATFRALRDCFRLARHSPKIGGRATEFSFPQWSRRFGCFSKGGLLGPRTPSASQNVRKRCRRFVRQTSTAWTGVC
jgi:hypothetical protein